MKKFIQLFAITLFILSFSNCKKSGGPGPDEDPILNPGKFAENFGSPTNKDFTGQIVDVSQNGLSGVTVKIGSATTQTDANGIFILKNAGVYDKFAYITATKAGFMNGSRALVPTSGTNHTKIMLLPATVTATVNTGAASNVSLTNGTKITFDGNFKTETGGTYSGAVNVIVNHLDPADANLADKMPGMLFAQAANGDAKLLETYGMVNVELRGTAGEKLQISNTAQIEFPITATQQGNAPATIPLWHFDETLGYWKEEGMATKSGNKYTGSVKHFSWWNVDLALQGIFLKFKIVDASGHPLPNIRTTLSDSYPANTNSNGEVSGLVPKNTSFVLKTYAINSCATLLTTQTIGPFTTDTTLPDVVVNPSSSSTQIKTINGTLKKCNNTNVTNGYVALTYDFKTYISLVTNGSFSLSIMTCASSNSFSIRGEDLDNNQNSGTTSASLNTPIVNVGNLNTCISTPESITYTIDGGAAIQISTNIAASVSGNALNISGGTLNPLFITGNSISAGTYTTQSGFQISGTGLSPGGISGAPTYSNFAITYTLLNVGTTGQFIDLLFNGTYNEQVMTGMGQGFNATRTISGTAHVLRDN